MRYARLMSESLSICVLLDNVDPMQRLWTVEFALVAVVAVSAAVGAVSLVRGGSLIVVVVAWALMLAAIFQQRRLRRGHP
jgi:steroid 5-alpha reductase family enzyme